MVVGASAFDFLIEVVHVGDQGIDIPRKIAASEPACGSLMLAELKHMLFGFERILYFDYVP